MARIRVNIVCLIGIAMAFISMMGMWTQVSPYRPDFKWIDIIWGAYGPAPAPMLFIVGTLMALITPLGGAVQLVSVIDTILFWMSPIYSYDPRLTVMPFIGGLAAIVVLYSIRSPRWIQLDRGEIPGREISTRLMRSLLTFWIEPNRREEIQENTVKEI